MTKQEASERYNIPIDILDEYESWDLCGTAKNVKGSRQYDGLDLKRLSMIMTLYDIGFSNNEVESYIRLLLLEDYNTEGERLQILNKKRGSTLDEIHFKQAQLDQLDYLRYEIQRAGKNRI